MRGCKQRRVSGFLSLTQTICGCQTSCRLYQPLLTNILRPTSFVIASSSSRKTARSACLTMVVGLIEQSRCHLSCIIAILSQLPRLLAAANCFVNQDCSTNHCQRVRITSYGCGCLRGSSRTSCARCWDSTVIERGILPQAVVG